MRSHIDWRRERIIPYNKAMKTSLVDTFFLKPCRKPRRESPKRTISVSGGLELLKIVSESDSGQCASKDTGPQRGWIGWGSHIGWRREQNITYKGVETSP